MGAMIHTHLAFCHLFDEILVFSHGQLLSGRVLADIKYVVVASEGFQFPVRVESLAVSWSPDSGGARPWAGDR